MCGSDAACEPHAMMQLSKRDRAVADLDAVGAGELRGSVDDLDLALAREALEPAGQLFDDRLLPPPQRIEVDVRLIEVDAVGAHLLRLGDHPRGVQQRLRRDAADVQTDAAEPFVALDEDRLQPQVGRPERCGVAARTGSEHEHLRVAVGLAGSSGWGGGLAGLGPPVRRPGIRCIFGGGGRRLAAVRRGVAVLAESLEQQKRAALRHAVADPDAELRHGPGERSRDVHRGLVGLQRDERVLRLDLVAGRDVDLDHGNVVEIPDIGDADLGDLGHSRARRRSDRTPARCTTNRAAAAPSITRWS